MRRSPLFSFPYSLARSRARSTCSWFLVAAAALPLNSGFLSSGLSQSSKLNAAEGAASPTVSDPYLVFVTDAAAHLRCGPGGDYYRTDPLRHGQELEVYVEYADGWLGVRPTADSFCWIPADATRIMDNKKPKSTGQAADAIDAEVIEDKTKAWIGTNLGRARRSLWQVQLGLGETVTILGRSERDGPDGPQVWYRIVPPSGEFRWIHRDQVVTTAEDLVAGLKPGTIDETQPEQAIEFLPAGPSSIASQQPASKRADEIASIRRLDEIEKHIDERQRSRFDRLRQDETGTELADASATRQDNTHNHHLRSFSERVTDGLTALMSGQSPNLSELEPLTGRSSRRPTELVPIPSSTIASAPAGPTPAVAVASSQPPATVPDSIPPSVSVTAESSTQAVGSGVASLAGTAMVADAKMVAATAHPEFRASESQVAIMSTPRLVASVDALPAAPQGLLSQGLQRAKLRTITSAQLEGVQRSVAESTPESLPMIMSTLMARGASAPEIRIVADAAQRFSMNDLAQRARDYEALARRRDGDTLVAATTFSNPPMVAAAPMQPAPMQPARMSMSPSFAASNSLAPAASLFATDNSFVTRAVNDGLNGPPSPIMPTSYAGGAIQPEAYAMNGQPGTASNAAPLATEQSGTLVEVYSADPNRPPYAITDRSGRTLAYVTPAPGVEIRNHLGSEVRVRGETGFLQGLETPHVLATQAERMMR